MTRLLYFYIVCLFTRVLGDNSVVEEFTKNKIVPDIIAVAPPNMAYVTFNGTLHEPGTELAPKQTGEQPIVWWNSTAGTYYTVMMTDADAPARSNASLREYDHWLVANVPGTNVSSGEVLASYLAAGPPKDSGLHRYLVLVYQQPAKLVFNETQLNNTRVHFSTNNFTKKYNMTAYAGTFFQAQFNEAKAEVTKLNEDISSNPVEAKSVEDTKEDIFVPARKSNHTEKVTSESTEENTEAVETKAEDKSALNPDNETMEAHKETTTKSPNSATTTQVGFLTCMLLLAPVFIS